MTASITDLETGLKAVEGDKTARQEEKGLKYGKALKRHGWTTENVCGVLGVWGIDIDGFNGLL